MSVNLHKGDVRIWSESPLADETIANHILEVFLKNSLHGSERGDITLVDVDIPDGGSVRYSVQQMQG